MSPEDLIAQAGATLEGVTPGPWTTEPRGWADGTVTIRCGEYDDHGFVHHSEREAAFIAAARTLVPELAASLRLALTVVEALATDTRILITDHYSGLPEHYEPVPEAIIRLDEILNEDDGNPRPDVLAAFERAGTDTNNETAE